VNKRVVGTEASMIVLTAGFFLYMMTAAPWSDDPVAMMQTVGAVSGAVGAVGLAMAIYGLVRRRP
jgi:hypothetical protein